MKKNLFGTDGIRSKANTYPMTVDIAVSLGRALAYQIINDNKFKKKISKNIIIGRDTRLSGHCFEQAISAGACSMGVDVSLAGQLPTSGIPYLIKKLNADAGVVVSASHNPYYDNGLKIFGSNGFKLDDIKEYKLEKQILLNSAIFDENKQIFGNVYRINNAAEDYCNWVINAMPKKMRLDDLRIVLDCANGAAYKVGPKIFKKLGAKLITLGVNPNGYNINKNVGSLYPNNLSREVIKNKSNIGISLDGDADRVVLVDEKGQVINGDALIALIAKDFFDHGKLNSNTIVVTNMSNMGLEKCLNSLGINIIRTNVGDRYVVECMHYNDLTFGGENSGHLIFSDHATTGDGLIAALIVVNILLRTKKSLSELASFFSPIPRAMINLIVLKKTPFKKLPKTNAIILDIKKKLENIGRVFVRYSGTESKIRILIEGYEQSKLNKYALIIANSINKELSK